MGLTLNKQQTIESLELTTLVKNARSKSIIDQQDDFEDCVLVWLDSSLKSFDHYLEEISRAREIVNNLKLFSKSTQCIDFLRTVLNDKVFLIVSNEFISPICAIKSELRALAAIYVYCDDNLSSTQRSQLETWARNNEPLITGVYSGAVDCFAQVAKDVHDICDHDSIPVTFLTPQTKTLKEASSFLIFHLFLQNILLRLPSNNTSREQQHQIFRACLHYYRENENISKKSIISNIIINRHRQSIGT